MSEQQTDVSGYVKNKGAVLASDENAKTAYKKQKNLLRNITKNSKDIEELRILVFSLIDRIDKLEAHQSLMKE